MCAQGSFLQLSSFVHAFLHSKTLPLDTGTGKASKHCPISRHVESFPRGVGIVAGRLSKNSELLPQAQSLTRDKVTGVYVNIWVAVN